MDNLARIIYYTNASIVLISSWAPLWIYKDKFNNDSSIRLRDLFETSLINSLKNYGIDYDIDNLAFVDYKEEKTKSSEIIDISNLFDEMIYENSRQFLIDKYIKDNKILDVNYIVIDDFNSFYKKENHIQTSYYGENKMLSSKDADIAIKKLNKYKKGEFPWKKI